MNPYESGAGIDMNMGHNSATPATTGADALRVAAQAALTALENLHEIDTETECITIDVRDEIDALRAALASAAQPEQALPQGVKETLHRALVKFSDSELERLRELQSPGKNGSNLYGVARIAAQQNICDAETALNWLAADPKAAPAPAAVAGPSEAVKFTDQSTADPVEKARRYLKAMGDQRTNSAYFFDDGYPRREIAQDALATLAVLEQLAAAPTTQQEYKP